MALLGIILFSIMTGRTINEHSAPQNKAPTIARKGSSERGSLPDSREKLFNLNKNENSRTRKGWGIGRPVVP